VVWEQNIAPAAGPHRIDMGSLEINVRSSIGVAVTLLIVAAGGEARAGAAVPGAPAKDQAAALKELVRDGDAAAGRPDWEAAAHDFAEAAKIAPGDARVRDKLRRALDRRARAREARAAHPPSRPMSAISDAPPDTAMILIYKDSRWRLQLKREALEARADAEAARAKRNEGRIARLRRDAAKQRAQESRLSLLIDQEQKKDEAGKVEMEKAFEGVGGVDAPMKSGVLH
jgi:hypothetical protein